MTDSRRSTPPPPENDPVDREPHPPFPAQSQDPPGLEKELEPRPRFRGEGYRAAGKLEGRVALITGGDSGIGRAVATFYAREGADLAILHLPEEAPDAEETRQVVEEHGRRCLLIEGDVRNARSCDEAVEETVSTFGQLDILVNNAAYQQSVEPPEDLGIEHFDTTLDTNVIGYFRMVRAALPHLTSGSAIIQTGSVTGLEGNPKLLDYSASKGAIHAFTKSLARALVDRGIRVNCVAPGPVWTPLNPADRPPSEVREFGGDTPYGRPAQPEELAPAYVFLASNADSGFITGIVLPVLGGETVAG